MRWTASGNVSRLGKSYLLNLRLLDTKEVLVVGWVTRRVRGDEEDLIDEMPEALRELPSLPT